MTTPTASALERLRAALAKGPTPGEWMASVRSYSFDPEPRFEAVVGPDGERIALAGVSLSSGPECEANSQFIAAANPEAIRELLSAIDAKDAEIAGLREALGEIERQDPIENCLDPQWAARIAKSARSALNAKETP